MKIKIFLFLLFISEIACAKNSVYLGVDWLSSVCKYKQANQQDLFIQRAAPQLGINLAYYYNDLIGIEVGFEQTINKHATTLVQAGTSEFGVENFTGIASNEYVTKRSMYGLYFTYSPIIKIYKNLSFVPSVGIERIHFKAKANLTEFDGELADQYYQNLYDFSFYAQKWVTRVGAKIQYLFACNVGVRALYVWRNTAQIATLATRNINLSQPLLVQLRNSSAVGIGAFYVF